MNGKYLIGIDGGTSTTKAAVYDLDGKQISLAIQESEGIYPQPGWAEFDPQVIEDTMFATCREANRKAGIDPQDILAVALSTTSPVFYVLDEEFRPLYNAIGWQDTRGLMYLEQGRKDLDVARRKRVSGTSLSYLSLALKIIWLKQQRPDLYQKAHKFSDAQGYMLRCFGADRLVVDNGSACRMQLQNIDTFGVASELLGELELTPNHFPEIEKSGSVVGQVSQRAAEKSGLRPGTPLVLAGHDQACCQVGAGVVRDGENNVTCGTFGMSAAVTDTRPQKISKLVHKTNLGTDNWSVEGMSISSAVNFKWFRDVFGQMEKIQSAQSGKSAYALLDEQAMQSPPGANGITYLPYLNGCMMGTHANPTARAVFSGMNLSTKRSDMIRAVLEGVCYELYDMFCMQQQNGCVINKVRLSGGISYSAFWCQMFANVFGVPVELTATEEAGTLGAAMFAGVGAGVYKDILDAVDRCVKVTKVYRVDDAAHAAYQEGYGRYMELGQKLYAAEPSPAKA